MSENTKTITFVAVGLVAILIGVVSAPWTAEVDEESLVGKDLTKAFDNPEQAKRLRIVRFDDDTATLGDFEVAEQNGLWSIPSKDGYPADAARQMAEAATSLMDRKILQVASKNAGDHEEYGVIDPLSPKLEPGQKGVGTRVTMSDDENKPLADLIVGKLVRDTENQRYVREAGRDVVYVIEIDPAKLTTNFEDWIEKDLLQLNAFDLKEVAIKDYSAEMRLVMTPQGRPSIGVAWDPRVEMTFAYDDTEGKWTPLKLQKFDGKAGPDGQYVDFKLADDEELNAESLNGLKTALDDLQIVDVIRKPQGLSENLKAGEDFMQNQDALRDLMSKGFAAAATQDGGAQEIISSDGEVIATMKNGVEYVLRFGSLTNVEGEDEKPAEKPAEPGAEAEQTKKSDVNRYLFVMARFNENAVKAPELAKLPNLPPQAAAAQASPADAAKPAEAPASAPAETPAETPADKPQEKAEADPPPAAEDLPQAEDPPTAPPTAEKAAEETAAAEAEKAAAPATPPADAPAAAPPTPAESPAAAPPAAGQPQPGDPAAAPASPEEEVAKIIAERKKRIEQENQRKLDEYEALRKKGQDSVKDLNRRFGDWYFVVDDNVFQKVRLSSDRVIKKKEAPAAAGAVPGQPNQPPVPPAGVPGLPAIPGATQ